MATNTHPFIQEIDLRQELVDLFTGDEFVNKMRTFILRKSRKDSSDLKMKCHCYNEQTREGKSDCPDCSGEGYLWDEKIIVGHMWIPRNIEMANQSSYRSYAGKVGRLNNTKWILVVPYAIDVSEKDTIYLPKIDDEGRLKFPIQNDKTYYVTEVTRTGFDFGRRDFTTIGLITK